MNRSVGILQGFRADARPPPRPPAGFMLLHLALPGLTVEAWMMMMTARFPMMASTGVQPAPCRSHPCRCCPPLAAPGPVGAAILVVLSCCLA